MSDELDNLINQELPDNTENRIKPVNVRNVFHAVLEEIDTTYLARTAVSIPTQNWVLAQHYLTNPPTLAQVLQAGGTTTGNIVLKTDAAGNGALILSDYRSQPLTAGTMSRNLNPGGLVQWGTGGVGCLIIKANNLYSPGFLNNVVIRGLAMQHSGSSMIERFEIESYSNQLSTLIVENREGMFANIQLRVMTDSAGYCHWVLGTNATTWGPTRFLFTELIVRKAEEWINLTYSFGSDAALTLQANGFKNYRVNLEGKPYTPAIANTDVEVLRAFYGLANGITDVTVLAKVNTTSGGTVTAGAVTFEIPLPVASNFSVEFDCIGSVQGLNISEAKVRAETTSKKALVIITHTNTAPFEMVITFKYTNRQ